MATFKFELVSPERLVLSTEADQVDLPGTEGDFGVLAGHAPFLTTLKTGLITVRTGTATEQIYVRGGFADVNANGVTVLAEKAVPAGEFKSETATAELGLAEAELAAAKSPEARQRAEVSLDQLKSTIKLIPA